MALTPSNMIPLGTPAPKFSLTDVVSNSQIELEKYRGKKAVVLMFICNHCPYVKHIQEGLVALSSDYASNKDVAFIAISSNDVENYPEDSPEKMKELALKYGYKFPYCFDETQEVAKAYKAACTPDFYILDSDLKIAYRGQMDDSRPGNGTPVSGSDLRIAIDALLNGTELSQLQKPSIGCNIKWKA
ncbi:MAG: thioredoxin family protein [Bdellovibrionota bacterium]